MNTVLSLSCVKAREFFLAPENYCSMDLPKYIDFKPVLDHVVRIIGNKLFSEILKDEKVMPSEFEGVNHQVLIKKDARYTFRPIQISNPYLYYLLVREMTNKGNWEIIRNRFKEFERPQIEVSSIPVCKSKKDKSYKAASVTNWWECVEQRSLSLSLQYKYLFVTDITNCYASIYTHTIAWAIMGKEEAKKKKGKGLIGNVIDGYIQGMQYGQTNGIPQGSSLYDFIAEIVLGYSDMLLADTLSKEKIHDYKILRYRDDYRIFSNNKEELERIAFVLQDVLSSLNFQLNVKKTFITEDVVQMSVKQDKIAYVKNVPLYRVTNNRIMSMASSLQQEALFIHQFAKENPNSGQLMKLLSIFSKRVRSAKKTIFESDAEVMIAIFTEVAKGSPKTYKMILHLISYLITKLPTTKLRQQVVNAVYEKFSQDPNIGEIQIWMQHITYKMPRGIKYTEPLCRVVANEPGVVLWNNDWIKEEFTKDFPQQKICSKWLRDSFTPVISIDEVSLFEIYSR